MATAYEIGSPTAGETQAEALASTHRLKLKPPTYDGNYATFEEWKYKFSAYMGLQDNIFPQLLSRAERATTVLTDAELLGAATTREVDTTMQQPQVHPHQHHQRPSSNNLQAIPRRNGPRSLQATLQQVCNTCWNKEHRLPHKTTQTQIRHQQL